MHHANVSLTVMRVQTHNCKHIYTKAPDKAVGLAQGLMATGLTGTRPGWQVVRGSAEAQASLRVSGFLSPKDGTGEPRQVQRGELTTTEVHVCFGLLLITVRHAVKPLSVATSSVKPARTALSYQDAGQVVLLTVLWFGRPLVEFELGKQWTILLVLLQTQAHSSNYFIISGKTYSRLTDQITKRKYNPNAQMFFHCLK